MYLLIFHCFCSVTYIICNQLLSCLKHVWHLTCLTLLYKNKSPYSMVYWLLTFFTMPRCCLVIPLYLCRREGGRVVFGLGQAWHQPGSLVFYLLAYKPVNWLSWFLVWQIRPATVQLLVHIPILIVIVRPSLVKLTLTKPSLKLGWTCYFC